MTVQNSPDNESPPKRRKKSALFTLFVIAIFWLIGRAVKVLVLSGAKCWDGARKFLSPYGRTIDVGALQNTLLYKLWRAISRGYKYIIEKAELVFLHGLTLILLTMFISSVWADIAIARAGEKKYYPIKFLCKSLIVASALHYSVLLLIVVKVIKSFPATIEYLVSTPYFVATSLFIGGYLFYLRERFTFHYGFIEVVVAIAAIWLAATSEATLLPKLFAIISGLYIMVRGFDNIGKSVKSNKQLWLSEFGTYVNRGSMEGCQDARASD